MTEHPFPSPPKPSLFPPDVIADLVEVQGRGWAIYREGNNVFIQINEKDRMVLSPNDSGVCSIVFQSSTAAAGARLTHQPPRGRWHN